MSESASAERAHIEQLRARDANGRRNFETVDTAEHAMQFVAIEIADVARQIQQRPRPARGELIDPAKCITALLRVGGNHDGNVMIGQRRRKFDVRNDVERHQFDAGIFQQKFDRRVAAHVGRRRKRQHAQPRRRQRARRAKQLMRGQDLSWIARPAGLSPSNCAISERSSPSPASTVPSISLVISALPQRTKIDAADLHPGEPRNADAIGASRLNHVDLPFGDAWHLTPHRS